MARPPAISMHRARGASVPSRRRRIRRPGRARRAAAQRPGPRRPRARPPVRPSAHPAAPIVPQARAAPPSCDRLRPAARPTAGRWKFGPAAHALPPRDARELGESLGARRRRPPRQGVGAPGPARFRFRLGQRSLAAQVADVEAVPCGPLSGEVRSFSQGKPEPGEDEPRGRRRGAGPGQWGLAVRFALAVQELSRPPKSYGRWHCFCSLPFRHVKERIIRNPGLRPVAEGLCSREHDSAALAASARVPPTRAEQSTSAPQSRSGSRRLLRTKAAGPRASRRKRTPVLAFGRRSRTTWPGPRSLPCASRARQPRSCPSCRPLRPQPTPGA
ncbi:uncharacterized protein LOC110260611 isoform X1 [Sus scrofa]|uniref:uncharacterized protein LOC110260611 isoform X1 n=1 Tax=Sus scrofa TaxID=9823 RepID=UPI000A2AFE49|nr:uncharacterized protein LOC110260611 isoform X1 [Sus scrofa]